MNRGSKKEQVEFQNGYAVGWAMCVPECFKDSLRTKAFAVGDVFYDTAKGYEGTWAEALHHIKLFVQIRSLGPQSVTCAFFRPSKDRTAVVQVETKSIPVEEFIMCLKEGFQQPAGGGGASAAPQP